MNPRSTDCEADALTTALSRRSSNICGFQNFLTSRASLNNFWEVNDCRLLRSASECAYRFTEEDICFAVNNSAFYITYIDRAFLFDIFIFKTQF